MICRDAIEFQSRFFGESPEKDITVPASTPLALFDSANKSIRPNTGTHNAIGGFA